MLLINCSQNHEIKYSILSIESANVFHQCLMLEHRPLRLIPHCAFMRRRRLIFKLIYRLFCLYHRQTDRALFLIFFFLPFFFYGFLQSHFISTQSIPLNIQIICWNHSQLYLTGNEKDKVLLFSRLNLLPK